MPDSQKGLFITIEGGEGVGKSTFIKLLAKHLASLFPQTSIISTREPGGTELAETIRQCFLAQPEKEDWLAISELCLMSAARAQHMAYLIRPALGRGEIVLCDRFADSSRVYQGMIGGVNQSLVDQLTNACCEGIEPDLTIILDCPIEVAQERMQKRAVSEGKTRFDLKSLAFHQQVRDGFLALAALKRDRYLVLDASGTSEGMALLGAKVIRERIS